MERDYLNRMTALGQIFLEIINVVRDPTPERICRANDRDLHLAMLPVSTLNRRASSSKIRRSSSPSVSTME